MSMDKISKVLEKSGYSGSPEGGDWTLNENELEQQDMDIPTQKKSGSRKEGVQVSQGGQQPSHAGSGWDERLLNVTSSPGEVSESFRVLRSRILIPDDGKPVPRTIMVTSVQPQEGKSFVTANLGITLAKGVDQHSLLVDCDLRKPSLAALFGMANERGLADYLQRDCEISSLIQKTSVNKLSILASGSPPVNPSELLGSAQMNDLVKELSARYGDRIVIFDSPPLRFASETKVLSQTVDAVILVVRYGMSSRVAVKKMIEDIGPGKIIGIVFNGQKMSKLAAKVIGRNQYHGYYHTQ